MLPKLWAGIPLNSVEHSAASGHHSSPTLGAGTETTEGKGQMNSAVVF